MTSPNISALRAQVQARQWYHTIELAPGLETPGFFDLRPVAGDVLPPSLSGMRCLDVATFDGFWSLEMQARGAREVLAIDLLHPRDWDWPSGAGDEALAAIGARKGAGEGFEIVMEALGREITRRDLSVYDLNPAEVGMFDFVYVGSLLLHLRDPVRALERVRQVCAGNLVVVDNYDPLLSLLHPRRPLAALDGDARPWWWRPNEAGLKQMVRRSGFELVGQSKRLTLPAGRGQDAPKLSLHSLSQRGTRVAIRTKRWGDPHLKICAK